MNINYNYLFKILFIGNSGTGKSAIVNRYTEDIYNNEIGSTIGVDFKIKTLNFKDSTIKLQIWDTAGQERFKSITTNYYRGVHGIVLVFDLSNRDSFNNIDFWLEEVKKNCNTKYSLIIVGNKLDKLNEKCISEKEAKDFIEKKAYKYLEVSAKKNENLDLLFELLIETIIYELKPEINNFYKEIKKTDEKIDLLDNFIINKEKLINCCI